MASTADKNRVRRLVYGGSTRTGSLSTADINSIIDDSASVWFAAADVALAEAGSGGRLKVGDLEIDQAGLLSKAALFRRRGAIAAKPYFGAVTASGKDSELSDSDRPDPQFEIGMHDNPGGGTTGDFY